MLLSIAKMAMLITEYIQNAVEQWLCIYMHNNVKTIVYR